MDIKRVIGINLQNLRQQKGLSQEKAAEKLDCSIDTYKRLEYGISSLKVEKIPAICELFDVTIYAILPVEMFDGTQSKLLRDLANIISKMMVE